MKILDKNQLLFTNTESPKFVLFSNNSKVGEILLPIAGVTYFPPEPKFSDEQMSLIFRIRFDFLDGDGMELLRRVVRFHHDDPYRHRLRLIVPGDCDEGYEVEPYGQWRAWFIDDEPIGYGPVEAQFISLQPPAVASKNFSEAQPWIVE